MIMINDYKQIVSPRVQLLRIVIVIVNKLRVKITK